MSNQEDFRRPGKWLEKHGKLIYEKKEYER